MVIGIISPDLSYDNMIFDADLFRSRFPALSQGSAIYLDSAATAFKPKEMIEAINQYYTIDTTTILRNRHRQTLANTERIEQARIKTAQLINANKSDEIIWTKGATESINLVAYSYALKHLTHTSEIIVSELEHHSNLIPWLYVAKQTGAKIVKWPIEQNGTLSIEHLQSLINNNTEIVAITQMSNVNGYQPDLDKISHLTHQYDAILVVDGAQGIVHKPIDVKLYDIDFYSFSCHKLYGPSGLGVLFGKAHLLEKMDIWQSGGKMVEHVTFTDYSPAPLPYKFEAGTPNIAGIIGFNAVLSFLDTFNMEQAENYAITLTQYAKEKINQLNNINIHSVNNSSLLTFHVTNIHHSDIATLLTEQDIMIRSGQLCASPLISALGCSGVIRASFMPYNNRQDVDAFILALQNALTILE